jgi:hypothetical protein
MQIAETTTKLPDLLRQSELSPYLGCLSQFSDTLGNNNLALENLFTILQINDIATSATWYLNNHIGLYKPKVMRLPLLLLERNFLEQFLKHPYIKYLSRVEKDICHSNIVSDIVKNDLSVFVRCVDYILGYACRKGYLSIVRYLIERDVVDPSTNHCNCIYFAVDCDNCDIVKYLLLDKRISHHPNITKVYEHCVDAARGRSFTYLSNVEDTLREHVPKCLFSRLSLLNVQLSHCKAFVKDRKLNVIDFYFEKEYLFHKMKCLYQEECPQGPTCPLSWLPNDIINEICRTLVYLG